MAFGARIVGIEGCHSSYHFVPVLWVPATDLGDGGHNFPGHAEAPGDVVPRDVVCDSQKHGASALGLQRVLGLGSYETAWTWLHKLRRAMVRPDRDRLKGWVEVDETMIGGLEEGV